MCDIRDVIKMLVELDSAQGVEKVVVRQENITKYLNIRSVYSENGIAIIETGEWEDAPENPSEEISSMKEDSKESGISSSSETESEKEEAEPERKRGRRKKEAESEEA